MGSSSLGSVQGEREREALARSLGSVEGSGNAREEDKKVGEKSFKRWKKTGGERERTEEGLLLVLALALDPFLISFPSASPAFAFAFLCFACSNGFLFVD